jgi:2-octaprenyl-6-methoxyphenol hydroxylase
VSADTDIAIVGGGPAGAALALALRDSPLRITVLEARPAQAAHAARGSRPIALSYGSRLLLERLGAWHGLSPAPIAHVHVSQRGGFGRVAINACDSGVPALGYVIDYSDVYAALADAARAAGSAYCDAARVTAIHAEGESSRVDFVRDGVPARLYARLTVVADGGDIDGLAPAHVIDYAQAALTARVRTTQPHRNTAYERFTREGPLALLPCGTDMALVWTLAPARAQWLEHADTSSFLAALREAFGGRVGEFTAVMQRASYPLALRRATHAAAARVISIGNAAQTLHPVAGQGFNLGLRDAWELAQMLRATTVQDIAGLDIAQRVAAARRSDRFASVAATHALVRVFSNDFFALDAMRGTAMTLLGCLPPARDFLARRMIFGTRG